jgi:hypothetical protein
VSIKKTLRIVTSLPKRPPDVKTHHVQPEETGVEGKEDNKGCKEKLTRFRLKLFVKQCT